MSDDLISRKAAYKAFSDYLNRNFLGEISSQIELSIGEIASVIKSISTAFDKEKVIEELRQEAIYELGIPEEKFNLDEGEYSSYCVISFSQAKRIVEKGGIE